MKSENNPEFLETPKGKLSLPSFLPDATRGVVRTIDARDIEGSGISALMVNIIHLTNHPGIPVIKKAGGIHSFMSWGGHIFSDSGGFQVFSLMEGGAKMANVTDRGFVYRLVKGGKKKILTPEKSIGKQFQAGADVLFCLDYCTHPQADYAVQLESVKTTIRWARRCKEEFTRRLETAAFTGRPPLLFAVVQGGNDPELRKMCCDGLFEIGFDGYGFGGWPVGEDGKLVEAAALTAELAAGYGGFPGVPPLHGLGIGKPENIVQAYGYGYRLFDCVLPTRDARRRRLYVFKDKPEDLDLHREIFYEYLYIQDSRHVRDSEPVEAGCDCFCCLNYSRAYLFHLFKVEEPLLGRLCTIHNLRFYSRLMARLEGSGLFI